jgi:methionine-S-sulfoxide reductase
MKQIYLAGGCFWGVQKYFDNIVGVKDTIVGYLNGNSEKTDYKQVCNGSGHAETVKISYDVSLISLTQLLDKFLYIIDPYSLNRQGNDIGVQYRTGVYWVDETERDIVLEWLANLQSKTDKKIVIECEPVSHFCQAESNHQKYLDNNPNGYCHIPKTVLEQAKNM